jgi:hypothetical protein
MANECKYIKGVPKLTVPKLTNSQAFFALAAGFTA